MKKTFKDFLTARDQLTKQCSADPVMKISYVIKKYTKLKGISESYDFKPKDQIIVEWVFDKTGNPVNVLSIKKNNEIIDVDKSLLMLKKWLGINTTLTKDNWFV